MRKVSDLNNFNTNADGFFVSTALQDNSDIILTCGYNKMAEFSQYHLASLINRNKIVGVSYNQFNPLATPPDECTVRANNVGYSGTNRCIEEDAAGCENIYRSPNVCSTLQMMVCPDSMPNDGSWAKLDAGSSMLTHLNTVSLQMLRNTSLGVDCRRIKAFDAHQTAFLLIEDSTRAAVAAVSNAFAAIIADTSEPTALRSTAMLLKADIHERLGQYDSAAVLYGQHAVIFDSTGDARYASWRADALTAYLTDTTRGAVYDSLMGVLHERICVDKFGAYSPPLVKPGHDNYPATGKAATSLDVHPNPFGNSTTVQWQLTENSHAHVAITDVLGREVSLVFDGMCNTGLYTADVHATELPVGVYYCRLTAMGKVLTRQIIIIR